MSRQADRMFGLIASFRDAEPLLRAVRAARAAGYTKLDACTPFPVEGMDEALQLKRSPLPRLALLGGAIGAGSAYFMLWYSAVIDYPWNIGGRPLNSWPSFIPITFELGVLGASLMILASVFVLNRWPEHYHPLFAARGFRRVTRDRFILVIEATDPSFDPDRTRGFLQSLHPQRVEEVSR